MTDDLVERVALVKKAMDACGSIRMVDSNATTYAEAVISCAVNVALEEAAKDWDRRGVLRKMWSASDVAAAIRAMMEKKDD